VKKVRKLYITDATLRRAGACHLERNRINELLGTKTRRVRVTYELALTIEVVFGRLTWARAYLLSSRQRRVYLKEDANNNSVAEVTELDRARLSARTFVNAYYSPRKRR
jgi:plasmid maintenance system antidote protein VapI